MTGLRKSWLLLALIFVAWGFGYVDKQAINIAAVSIREELSLSASQMGTVMSSFFLMYSVMTLAGSYLVSRFGSRKSLIGIVALWAIFSCFTGMANSFLILILIRFLLGLSQGGFAPITSVAITELFPPEMQGRAKTFQVSAGSMGVAFGMLFCAASTAYFGWRAMFFFFGIVGMIVTVLLYRFYHPLVCKDSGPISKQIGLRTMLKDRLVLKLAFIQFGLGVFIWGLNAWLPSYWLEVKGLDMVQMGALSMVPWIVSFVLMNFSSYLLETCLKGQERATIVLSLAIGGALMYAMLQVDGISTGFFLLTVITVLMSIASAVVYMIPMKYMDVQRVGTATGIIIFGQQLAGVIAPVIMGYLITLFSGSYDAVFGFVILVVFFGAGTALSLKIRKDG